MTPFDTVFRDVASGETRSWTVVEERSLPRGSYVLRELYCTELDCDCRRVLLQVHHVETRTIAATINYAFGADLILTQLEDQKLRDRC